MDLVSNTHLVELKQPSTVLDAHLVKIEQKPIVTDITPAYNVDPVAFYNLIVSAYEQTKSQLKLQFQETSDETSDENKKEIPKINKWSATTDDFRNFFNVPIKNNTILQNACVANLFSLFNEKMNKMDNKIKNGHTGKKIFKEELAEYYNFIEHVGRLMTTSCVMAEFILQNSIALNSDEIVTRLHNNYNMPPYIRLIFVFLYKPMENNSVNRNGNKIITSFKNTSDLNIITQLLYTIQYRSKGAIMIAPRCVNKYTTDLLVQLQEINNTCTKLIKKSKSYIENGSKVIGDFEKASESAAIANQMYWDSIVNNSPTIDSFSQLKERAENIINTSTPSDDVSNENKTEITENVSPDVKDGGMTVQI